MTSTNDLSPTSGPTEPALPVATEASSGQSSTEKGIKWTKLVYLEIGVWTLTIATVLAVGVALPIAGSALPHGHPINGQLGKILGITGASIALLGCIGSVALHFFNQAQGSWPRQPTTRAPCCPTCHQPGREFTIWDSP